MKDLGSSLQSGSLWKVQRLCRATSGSPERTVSPALWTLTVELEEEAGVYETLAGPQRLVSGTGRSPRCIIMWARMVPGSKSSFWRSFIENTSMKKDGFRIQLSYFLTQELLLISPADHTVLLSGMDQLPTAPALYRATSCYFLTPGPASGSGPTQSWGQQRVRKGWHQLQVRIWSCLMFLNQRL